MDAAAKGINTQRKRVGRPPKNQRPATSDEDSIEMYANNNKNMADDALANAANECRRSSRKKIIKFDVRDLLNKNRKPPKVQIEARIDSNVSSSSRTNSTSLCHNSTAISTFQHCNIIKRINTVPEYNAKTITSPEQPKRGRGRPPKYRSNEATTAIALKEKAAPVLATSVSVLIKKLDLAHGQRFKISGSSFEKINANELQNNSINNAEETMEETVILDLSDSSIISPTENIESSGESLDTSLLANVGNNKLRQRNFAAVSVFNDTAQAETDEFIVAAVEEITTDKNCVDDVQYNKGLENTSYDVENYEEVSVEDTEMVPDETLILMMDTTSQEGDSSVSIIEFDESDSQLETSIIQDESEHEDNIHVLKDDDIVEEIVVRDDSSQDVVEEIVLTDDNVDCEELAKQQNKLTEYSLNTTDNLSQSYEADCIVLENTIEMDQDFVEIEEEQMKHKSPVVADDMHDTDSIIELIAMDDLEQEIIAEETIVDSNAAIVSKHEEVEVLTTSQEILEKYACESTKEEEAAEESAEMLDRSNESVDLEKEAQTLSEADKNDEENEYEEFSAALQTALNVEETENLNENHEINKINETAEVDENIMTKNVEQEYENESVDNQKEHECVAEEIKNETEDSKKDRSNNEDIEHEQFLKEIERILQATNKLRENANYTTFRNIKSKNIEKIDTNLSNNKEIEEENMTKDFEEINESENVEQTLRIETENDAEPIVETEVVDVKNITETNREFEQKVEIPNALIKLQTTEKHLESAEILDKKENEFNAAEVNHFDIESADKTKNEIAAETDNYDLGSVGTHDKDKSKEIAAETNNFDLEPLGTEEKNKNEISAETNNFDLETVGAQNKNEEILAEAVNFQLEFIESLDKNKIEIVAEIDNADLEPVGTEEKNKTEEISTETDNFDLEHVGTEEKNKNETDNFDFEPVGAQNKNKIAKIPGAAVNFQLEFIESLNRNKNYEIATETNNFGFERIGIQDQNKIEENATKIVDFHENNSSNECKTLISKIDISEENLHTNKQIEKVEKKSSSQNNEIEIEKEHIIKKSIIPDRSIEVYIEDDNKLSNNTKADAENAGKSITPDRSIDVHIDEHKNLSKQTEIDEREKSKENAEKSIISDHIEESRIDDEKIINNQTKQTDKEQLKENADVLEDNKTRETACKSEDAEKMENHVLIEKPCDSAAAGENVKTEENVPEIAAEVVQDINVQTSTLLDILRTVKCNEQIVTDKPADNAAVTLPTSAKKCSISAKLNEKIVANAQPAAEKICTSPATVQRRRTEKRYTYVVDYLRPKTLEETFAEIAEQSTKVVLEMAAVDKDDVDVQPLPQSSCDITPSNKRRSKSHETTNISANNGEERRSKSHDVTQASTSNVSTNLKCSAEVVETKPSPKKRGRKPKNKDQTADTKIKTTKTAAIEAKTVLNELFSKDKKMEVIREAEEFELQKTANTDNAASVEIAHELQQYKKTENLIKPEKTADKIEKVEININTDKIKTENDNKQDNLQLNAIENAKIVEELQQTNAELLQQQSQVQSQDETPVVDKKRKRERKKSRWDVAAPDVAEVVEETLPAISKNDAHINKNLRHNQLKAAFQAALTEVSEQQQDVVECNKNKKLDLSDTTLPYMLYKSMAARLDQTLTKSDSVNIDVNQCTTAEKAEKPATDALSDIEKFIADGVSLLKHSHKEELAEQQQLQLSNVEAAASKEHEQLSCVTHRKTELEMGITFETPADTPVATPTTTPPPKSPNQNYGIAIVSNGDETAALRRSHRIKQITKTPKALVGRGLVRDKERFALKDDLELKATYSLDDHLTDLAEVEAKNAKFLKEMEERLSNFQVIKENEYKCERIVSKEARKMICDCFLTAEEEERGELGCGEDCLNRLLMIECGPNCIVKERCTNIRFQKFLCSPCRVFRTEKKGFGIMADVEILPGEFIMEYIGEVIDSDEFEHRRTSYSREKNRHYYFMALRSDAFIDATTKGNISRFINHSCDPNAETQKWTVNGELRIGFFSRKSIMPGEEITFDYQYQRYGREAQRCYCESANCRGWIGEEPNSDEGEQQDEETDDDNLAERLLGAEDDDSEESEDDPLEVQKKLEYAAAAAKLTPLSEDMHKHDRQRKKLDKLDEEDSTAKFRKLLSKISEKVAKKKQERNNKSRQRKTRKPSINLVGSPSKSRFLEDPDIEDEVNFLRSCGLKNQSDTLSLSRLMVRSKLPQTRLNLLEVLRQGDEPCRRLFLDYHGLRLLHGWMSEDGNNMDIRLALLQTLMRLPISNKTVLKDSKVLQTVRSWSQSNATASENNSSPSDESSKESNAVVADATLPDSTSDANVAAAAANDTQAEVKELALKLCGIWDNLQEIFRIPKRERIEQMKEHEREADRQYAADLAVDDKHNEHEAKEDERQQQRDRFGRDLNRFNRPYSNRERHIPSAFSRRSSYESGDTRHLSKEKRREMFAAKVAREEAEKLMAGERREFDIKCRFFGLDPKRTKPQDIPFCVNTNSGQWYAYGRRPIHTPPNYIHAPRRPKLKSTNIKDYKLPESLATLPKEWRYAITPHGLLYYYHVVYRCPQWEPPTAKQLADCKNGLDSIADCALESTDDDDEAIKDMDEPQFNTYKDKKVDGRRQKRRNCLVTERPISPRRDEDRLYNQQEVRKYKENKEKIRKRKEEIRRKRAEVLKQAAIKAIDDENTRDVDNSLDVNDKVVKTEATDELDIKAEEDKSAQPAALPIQEYLLSSDEEDIQGDITGNSSLALFYKIVEGDKIVDEFDALVTNRRAALKRPLPALRDALPAAPLPVPDVVLSDATVPAVLPTSNSSNNNNNTSSSNNVNNNNNSSSSSKSTTKRKDLSSLERYEQHKRRKLEKREKEKEKRRQNAEGNGSSNSRDSDTKLRKLREKFRCDIAGIIVHYLKPYRKSNCTSGRIRSDDDFNHLARKLTHFVMLKEMKYCEAVGQMLVVTESVKNKSRDFIKKYMAKYGEEYAKPANDPEFKDIPFNIKHSSEQKQQLQQQQQLPPLPTLPPLPPLPTLPPLPSTD